MENTRFQTALYILLALSQRPQEILNSNELADGLRTNPVFVRRILTLLATAGLIQTIKGRKGGVQLKAPVHSIHLFDIYQAVALPKVITAVKREPNSKCPVSCSMHKIIEDVGDLVDSSVKKSLSKVLLSSLLNAGQ